MVIAFCRDSYVRPHRHALLPRSELVILHETTNGPFVREEQEFAPWSPADGDRAGIRAFTRRIE